MGKAERALDIAHDEGLAVFRHRAAGGGVAHMTDGDLPDKLVQFLLVEHLADKSHVLVMAEFTVIADGNAAAFLTSVLQGYQSVIDARGDRYFPVVGINAENAAFLVQLCEVGHGKVNAAAVANAAAAITTP